jgi:probable HAF family extracellular repeat protein
LNAVRAAPLALVLLAGILAGELPPVHAAPAYTIVDLGTLPEGTSHVIRGLNTAGQVVGGAGGAALRARAFLLTGNRLEIIEGHPGTDWSAAQAISDVETVVGSANTRTAIRAFRWRRTGVEDLGTLSGDVSSQAFGINASHVVVGYSSGPGGRQAVRWAADGRIEALGRLSPGDLSQALAVNDRGDVVGSSGTRAFLWTRTGGMRALPAVPGHARSEAVAVNNRGEIAGWAARGAESVAVLWTPAGAQSLATLPGGTFSRALAVNDRTEVVGTSDSAGGSRAFVWTAATGMRDLNGLIPPSGVILTRANSINHRGLIVAVGRDDDGSGHHDHRQTPVRVILLVPLP